MNLLRSLITRILLLFTAITLGACASTWSSKDVSQTNMQMARESKAKGDAYEALRRALWSYDLDNSNKSAKRFIADNLADGISQIKTSLTNTPLRVSELNIFSSKLENLSSLQSSLKEYKFIEDDIVNVNAIRETYEAALQNYLLQQINGALKDKDSETAKRRIADYKKARFPKNEKILLAANNLQLLFLSQDKYSDSIEFAQKFQDYLSEDTLRITFNVLLDYANNEEKNNGKKALETYQALLDIDKNNVTAAAKVMSLKNQLLTMIAVLDVDNITDEFVPIDNKDFARTIKSSVDSKENLVEVILNDSGLDDVRDRAINYDFLRNNNLSNISFESNLKYLISSRISNLKIGRPPMTTQTKSAKWSGSSFKDGISAALAEYQAYGQYKVQYYQYDEHTARVNAKLITDVIICDIKKKKVVLKERLESVYEKEITWADNPMAVGIINKIPATVYPTEISLLMNRNRELPSDSEIKKDLVSKMTEEITNRVKHFLSTTEKTL